MGLKRDCSQASSPNYSQKLSHRLSVRLRHGCMYCISKHSKEWTMCINHRIYCIMYQYWNWNVIILMKFSSLAVLEVVILTTSSAANDDIFIKMTFLFQCSIQTSNIALLIQIILQTLCQISIQVAKCRRIMELPVVQFRIHTQLYTMSKLYTMSCIFFCAQCCTWMIFFLLACL